MPRKGYTTWNTDGDYGSRQKACHGKIFVELTSETCKEIYSLMEMLKIAEASGVSRATFYRALRRMEEENLIQIEKNERTCRVTIRNLLR
jgi:DNA-binding MarR family transcriptional regulator